MTEKSLELEQKHAAVAALLDKEELIVHRRIVAARFPHLAKTKKPATLIDDYLNELRTQFPDKWKQMLKEMDKESKNPLLPSNR